MQKYQLRNNYTSQLLPDPNTLVVIYYTIQNLLKSNLINPNLNLTATLNPITPKQLRNSKSNDHIIKETRKLRSSNQTNETVKT